MADSENSRTLPAISRKKENPERGTPDGMPYDIDRRNPLTVAARLLPTLIAELGKRTTAGPTPVKELWPRWYAFHQRRVRATRLKERLEQQLLEEVGGLPIVTLGAAGTDGVVEVRSFADIKRMASTLDADQLSWARAELRRRRRRWKDADQRFGFSAAVAQEQELAVQAGISGRVMMMARPASLTEVAAALHCLIVMHDPGLKFEDSPWCELRTLLRDLIRFVVKSRPKSFDGSAYPSKAAGVRAILNLAKQYQDAAGKLAEGSSKLNQFPQRLLALQAMELYLNAFLLAKSVDLAMILGLRHDLGERTQMASRAGLVLRKRTAAHLAMLSATGEYDVIRYCPERGAAPSQVNRVMATLDELSRKVRKVLRASSG